MQLYQRRERYGPRTAGPGLPEQRPDGGAAGRCVHDVQHRYIHDTALLYRDHRLPGQHDPGQQQVYQHDPGHQRGHGVHHEPHDVECPAQQKGYCLRQGPRRRDGLCGQDRYDEQLQGLHLCRSDAVLRDRHLVGLRPPDRDGHAGQGGPQRQPHPVRLEGTDGGPAGRPAGQGVRQGRERRRETL